MASLDFMTLEPKTTNKMYTRAMLNADVKSVNGNP
jgi:hypothetical protein